MKRRILVFISFAVVFAAIACHPPQLSLEDSGNLPLEDSSNLPPGTEASPPEIKPLPVVTREEYKAGITPGDHTQHMQGIAYCASDPDRIYMGQDVDNVWVSRDFGKNWFTLSNEGLYSPFVISIEVDPLDKNRVLAAVNCRKYDVINMPFQGIYLSKDGGITWEQTAKRGQLSAVRSSTHMLAYAPTSKNKDDGYATQWYAAFCEGEDHNSDDGFLSSGDGGENWKEIRKLPASTFGTWIRGIKVHTTDQQKVFLYGSAGLFRFEDATDSNGEVTKLSGGGGFPEGDVMGSLYQSPNGSVLIVAVVKKGIYESTNGGATWNVLYDWDKINYCYVNENHPNMIFAVPYLRSGEQIRISRDGGQTWYSPSDEDVVYRPGYDHDNWDTKLNGQFAYVLPDPRNENEVFMHNNSKNFRSDDGGKHWHYSDDGFNGTQHAAFNENQMFDPKNPDRFCYFMVDRGVQCTDSRGRWFYPNTVMPKKLGLGWKTVYGGALQPGKPVILACVGKGTTGKLLRSPDDGATWNIVRNANEKRWVVAFDLEDPNYCYQWRERSSDAGLTWKELPMPDNSIICGVSPSNGKILYAMDCEGTARKVWRSVDRGDTWKLAFETSWDLTFPGPSPQFVFQVDPKDPDIVYTSSTDGQITRWDVSKMPAKSKDLVFPGGAEDNFFINKLAIDPRYPDIMYALNMRANTGHKFFRTLDGGATWQNISSYISEGSENGLSVSPVTGEVFISGQNGSAVMLPPYPTKNTTYSIVPYSNNHLNTPYN